MTSESESATQQSVLPGTKPFIAIYECGHGTAHRLPTDDVRILKMGVGYIAYCTCGGHDVDDADEMPHLLGDHSVLVGGEDIGENLWLALDAVADGWWQSSPDDAGYGDKSSREKRQDLREQYKNPDAERDGEKPVRSGGEA